MTSTLIPLAVGLCVALTSMTSVQSAVTSLSTLQVLNTTGHPQLLQLLQLANLTELFDNGDDYTLFVPSDRVFQDDLAGYGLTMDQLKNDTDLLAAILAYHVIPGKHNRGDFYNERTFTTLNGAVLRANHYVANGLYFIDGAQLGTRPVENNNTIIHAVRHMLYPIKGSVYTTIAADPDLSLLKTAIDTAGLQGFLSDQSPITIFAPTDDAFALLDQKLHDLMANPDVLKALLTYHVIPGSLYHGGMHDESLHTFDEADRLTLDIQFQSSLCVDRNRFCASWARNGECQKNPNYMLVSCRRSCRACTTGQTDASKVDTASFKNYDISATNGVIHKISDVLVPDSLKGQI